MAKPTAPLWVKFSETQMLVGITFDHPPWRDFCIIVLADIVHTLEKCGETEAADGFAQILATLRADERNLQ